MSIVIDVTPRGIASSVRKMMQTLLIPYFNFDFSSQSFFKAMEIYLRHSEAQDVVFILQDAEAVQAALFNFITTSTLRTILLNQLPTLNAHRLKTTLRPTPSAFVIIADSTNMKRLFRSVRNNLSDEKR